MQKYLVLILACGNLAISSVCQAALDKEAAHVNTINKSALDALQNTTAKQEVPPTPRSKHKTMKITENGLVYVYSDNGGAPTYVQIISAIVARQKVATGVAYFPIIKNEKTGETVMHNGKLYLFQPDPTQNVDHFWGAFVERSIQEQWQKKKHRRHKLKRVTSVSKK